MNQDLQINENSLVSDIQRPIYISTLADRSNPDYNQPTPRTAKRYGRLHLFAYSNEF